MVGCKKFWMVSGGFGWFAVLAVTQFQNHVGNYSIFLQHIQQPLTWLVCMDCQLPEELFQMINFVAALILVDLSSKQQIY